jgi:hypothetical protein
MRKREIEKLLVQAVAEALGVADDAGTHTSQTKVLGIAKPGSESRHDRAAA